MVHENTPTTAQFPPPTAFEDEKSPNEIIAVNSKAHGKRIYKIPTKVKQKEHQQNRNKCTSMIFK